MADEPASPQQLIDDAAKALGETPISDLQNTDLPTTIVSTQQDSIPVDTLPIPPTPTPEPMIVPTKEKEEQTNEQTMKPPKPEKKKSGKGILIATLLFFILTLPIAIYYVTQSPQFAEIRSRAAGGTCTKTAIGTNACNSVSCSATSESACNKTCCSWKATVVPTATPKPQAPCGGSQGESCIGTSCSNAGMDSVGGACPSGQSCCKPKIYTPSCKAPGSSCGVSGECCNGVCAGAICQGSISTTPTPTSSGSTCPANIAACKPGGVYYYAWLPNHVICGTCNRADNFNTCGTWEGEAGVWKDKCCGTSCSGSYPWTFENQCLSSNASNREGCYHIEADCNRVKPCTTAIVTEPTSPPGQNNPTPTNTPAATNTPVPTNTPTGPTNTPSPGTCDASCDTDSNCESGLSCVTTTGVKRCRKASCPDATNCSCPSATATPTTYYANATPTRASLIATAPTAIPTNQPTPKIPVAGVGPGIIGVLSVAGSILLLLIGLAL